MMRPPRARNVDHKLRYFIRDKDITARLECEETGVRKKNGKACTDDPHIMARLECCAPEQPQRVELVRVPGEHLRCVRRVRGRSPGTCSRFPVSKTGPNTVQTQRMCVPGAHQRGDEHGEHGEVEAVPAVLGG